MLIVSNGYHFVVIGRLEAKDYLMLVLFSTCQVLDYLSGIDVPEHNLGIASYCYQDRHLFFHLGIRGRLRFAFLNHFGVFFILVV